MKTPTTLHVSECFYSIQGEGATMGIPAVFLRLSGCNLLCKSKDWVCDTIDVWRKGVKTNFEDVLSREFKHRLVNGAHLVITGGEPMLHQKPIIEFLNWLHHDLGGVMPTIEIETNGTIQPTDDLIKYVSFWNVSPKLANSGEPYSRRVNEKAIAWLNQRSNSIFKFVISRPGDIGDVISDYSQHGKISPHKIVLMPAGESQQQLNETRQVVADECVRLGYRYSERLHIVIWNQKTGV